MQPKVQKFVLTLVSKRRDQLMCHVGPGRNRDMIFIGDTGVEATISSVPSFACTPLSFILSLYRYEFCRV